MAGARVTVDHVSRAYGSTLVLDDVSFVVEPGEFVALTGPSGAGKTTLLQLIGSLDRPTKGRVLVDDVVVGDLAHPAGFRRATVGFVFQLHYLLSALSVLDNVELPMVAARVPHRERTQRALSLLEEVGLGDRAGARPSELSGGERQRVAIARALAGRPRLVLADEPAGALDTHNAANVWRLLGEVRDREGATVIVVTHDIGLAEQADRMIRLVDGRLAEPAQEISAQEGTS